MTNLDFINLGAFLVVLGWMGLAASSVLQIMDRLSKKSIVMVVVVSTGVLMLGVMCLFVGYYLNTKPAV